MFDCFKSQINGLLTVKSNKTGLVGFERSVVDCMIGILDDRWVVRAYKAR